MEVEKVKEIMNKMGSMINSGQPMFSKDYLMRMLGLRKKDLRMEKINNLLVLLFLTIFISCSAQKKVDTYDDTWESLSAYDETAEWFKDAKFGIYAHWGVMSVPAYANDWYARNMHIEGSDEFKHHVDTYGEHSKFGYHDYIPMFKAENFDDGKLELDQVITSPEGVRFIGECEGKDNKQIDITKFRQLSDSLNEDFERENVNEKAVKQTVDKIVEVITKINS